MACNTIDISHIEDPFLTAVYRTIAYRDFNSHQNNIYEKKVYYFVEQLKRYSWWTRDETLIMQLIQWLDEDRILCEADKAFFSELLLYILSDD
jgi:hypothetical protein